MTVKAAARDRATDDDTLVVDGDDRRRPEHSRPPMGSVGRAIRGVLDYGTSIWYGVVYDYIVERFAPYQALQREVSELVASTVLETDARKNVRVLDIGCGPGNFAVVLARAGFAVTGIDDYAALVNLAQEKRRAEHMPNLTFTHGDLAAQHPFKPATFDVVVNVHFLYAHPRPLEVLREAHRLLKPGGHALFVNLTRRVEIRRTFEDLRARLGLAAALHSLLWSIPNAIFETFRRPVAPHYWDESEFSAHLADAGFVVLTMRRTFLEGASVLAWAEKPVADRA